MIFCILREIEINKNFHSLRFISVCDPLILGFPISLNFRCGSKNLDHNLWSRDLVICNFCYWIKKRCDLLILICIKIVIFDFDPSKIVILNLRIKNCVWSMILILAKSVILWSWDFCKWILNCGIFSWSFGFSESVSLGVLEVFGGACMCSSKVFRGFSAGIYRFWLMIGYVLRGIVRVLQVAVSLESFWGFC